MEQNIPARIGPHDMVLATYVSAGARYVCLPCSDWTVQGNADPYLDLYMDFSSKEEILKVYLGRKKGEHITVVHFGGKHCGIFSGLKGND